MDDNSTFRNMSIVDKPSVDPDHTHFPDIVADVDKGTLSIFIFLYLCCLHWLLGLVVVSVVFIFVLLYLGY